MQLKLTILHTHVQVIRVGQAQSARFDDSQVQWFPTLHVAYVVLCMDCHGLLASISPLT